MDNLQPISNFIPRPNFIRTTDDKRPEVKVISVKYVPFLEAPNNFYTIQRVDEIIKLIVINKNFIDYVNKTNTEILQDPSKFEDMSKKYR